MKVVVTGASGLIGSALVANLGADGHDVRRLVRRVPQAGDEFQWQPSSGHLDPDAVDGFDAVVHLAGAGIGDHRWTDDYKKEIRESRVNGTTAVATAVASAAHPPRVLVAGSAVGYYGDTGENPADESTRSGDGFLASVVREWEAATAPAADAGVRVVMIRSGI